MKTKKFDTKVWLERITLNDKKSMFRASHPTLYLLRIWAQGSGGNIIVREFSFDNKAQSDEHYTTIRAMFE